MAPGADFFFYFFPDEEHPPPDEGDVVDERRPAHVVERAHHLARRMPLVHFPVSTQFETWSAWPELRSRAARGLASSGDPFGRLRDEHVFTYAGPSCFHKVELLEHNGTRGRQRYGAGLAGDRRAWTWEVRFVQAIPFEHVSALHVPFDLLERALSVVGRWTPSTGDGPRVESLPPEVPAECDTLYEDSGRVLKELVG